MHFNPSRTVRVFLLLGTIFLWLAVALAALETYTRARFYWISQNNSFVRGGRERRIHQMGTAGESLWLEKFSRYRPNAYLSSDYQGEQFEIRINSHGYRGGEVVIPKPQGRYRIVCVGGSTTVEGLTNETTYPAVLEELLNAHFETDQIEVLNCGISGFVSSQEAARLPEYLEFEPDLLIHYNLVNDIWASRARLSRAASPWKRRLRHSWFLTSAFPGWLGVDEFLIRRRLDRATFPRLIELAQGAREADVEVAICTFSVPDVPGLTRSEREFFSYDIQAGRSERILSLGSYVEWVEMYNAGVEQLCEKEGYLFVPVAAGITGGADCFIDICHMTDPCIARKAEVIFEGVKEFVGDQMDLRSVELGR